jgi:hypothetical protein
MECLENLGLSPRPTYESESRAVRLWESQGIRVDVVRLTVTLSSWLGFPVPLTQESIEHGRDTFGHEE